MVRIDGRKADEGRIINFIKDYQKNPLASVLVECGNTRVLCSVSVEEKVPGWMKAQGVLGGWVTAEYAMLPSATHTRGKREVKNGKESGRTMEIQRLIGRALRAVVDFEKLGERTFMIDCDVIDADGGTRCASISGAFAAFKLAVVRLMERGLLKENPIKDSVAAISVGIVNSCAVVDLCYDEDSKAGVDMNIVMTGDGRFVELQGTAEEEPFNMQELNELLALAKPRIKEIIEMQDKLLEN
ncbi:MAG: ribonuclease PH [Lentisphaeria bacterium]